jgi:hypothetical protein
MIAMSPVIGSSAWRASPGRSRRRSVMYSQCVVATSMSGFFEKRMHSRYAASAGTNSPRR